MNDWERYYDAWKTSGPPEPEPDEDELFYEAADRAMDERE